LQLCHNLCGFFIRGKLSQGALLACGFLNYNLCDLDGKMSFNKSMFSSVHDNWSTPKDTFNALNREFNFNDDPCPLGGTGGLDREWGGRTFVNPPYSDIAKWVAYAFEQSQKGKLVVMLIPSRTDTRWWHNYIMRAKEIRFIKGRLKFGGSKNSAPFPSCVVVF